MASQRQIEANRRNAQKCTGPKTEAGKRKSRFNGVIHGLTAEIAVLPHENDLEYHTLRASLVNGYKPANPQELMLVDQISVGYWRTMRARAIENDMLTGNVKGRKKKHGLSTATNPETDDMAIAVVFDGEDPKSFENYFRYDATISRDYFRSLKMLETMQSRRVREEHRYGTNDRSLPFIAAASDEPALPRLTMTAGAGASVSYNERGNTRRPDEQLEHDEQFEHRKLSSFCRQITPDSKPAPHASPSTLNLAAFCRQITPDSEPAPHDSPSTLNPTAFSRPFTPDHQPEPPASHISSTNPATVREQTISSDSPITADSNGAVPVAQPGPLAGPTEAEVMAAAIQASASEPLDFASEPTQPLSISHKTVLPSGRQQPCSEMGLVSFRTPVNFLNTVEITQPEAADREPRK